MAKCYLTTFDNPFSPIDQFDSWLMYDLDKGYNSCSMLARFAFTSDQLSDVENEKEIERAIDDIIQHDFRNIFKKIKVE